MILNSRKRRQIRQAQQEGQRTIASLHSNLVSGGESEQTASDGGTDAGTVINYLRVSAVA